MHPPADHTNINSSAPNWFQRRFARITSTGRFLREVDGLRFLAISSVVLYHCLNETALRNGLTLDPSNFLGASRVLYDILSRGHYGVQLFFVISAYVLSQPFAASHYSSAPKPSLPGFYLRRVTRLEPPYVVNLILCYLLVATAYTLGIRQKGTGFLSLLPHLGASVTYSHAWIYHDLSLVNGVAWSLEIEIQFYLLLPLILILVYRICADRYRNPLLLLAILAHGLWLHCTGNGEWYLNYSLLGYINYFLAGICWADLNESRRRNRKSPSLTWDFMAFAALAIFILSERWKIPSIHYPLLFATLGLSGTRSRLFRSALSWTPIWLIGGMCYTIYLYHLIIITAAARLLHIWYNASLPFWVNFFIQLPLLIALVLVLSAALYLAIERPCMNRAWPQDLWRHLQRWRPRREA